MKEFAAALLLAGVVRHYAWPMFPVALQSSIWNIGGALAILFLLAVVIRGRSWLVLLVGLWWAAEELLVVGCTAGYIIAPWELVPGQMCSQLLHFDFAKIGALILAALVLLLMRRP